MRSFSVYVEFIQQSVIYESTENFHITFSVDLCACVCVRVGLNLCFSFTIFIDKYLTYRSLTEVEIMEFSYKIFIFDFFRVTHLEQQKNKKKLAL